MTRLWPRVDGPWWAFCALVALGGIACVGVLAAAAPLLTADAIATVSDSIHAKDGNPPWYRLQGRASGYRTPTRRTAARACSHRPCRRHPMTVFEPTT